MKTSMIIFFFGCYLLSEVAAINCNGKPFLCTGTTHFLICVDTGPGGFATVDNEIQACPQGTVCSDSNSLECMAPATTLKPVTKPKTTTTTTTAKPIGVPSSYCPQAQPGNFGDPANCHVYYRCIGSLKFKYFCTPGTVFNSATGTCSANKNDCGTSVADFHCTTAGNFADPKSCYSYFTCVKSGSLWIINRFNCKALTSFYSLLGTCGPLGGGCKGKLLV